MVADLTTFRREMLFWLTGLSIAGILGAVLLAAMVAIGGVTRPLSRITAAMHSLSAGVTDVRVTDHGRGDEIGGLAGALEIFRAQTLENRRLAQIQIDQAAQATVDRRAAMMGLADAVEGEIQNALGEIHQSTDRVAASAVAMTASAERTGAAAVSVAGSANMSLKNAQTVAGAADQLTASIREIGDQVSRSAVMTGQAVRVGHETRDSIDALNQTVGRIGAVADLIAGIASQTNLLALNATIEAARAGDAGKGFAVVANEVKQLASQTARSTSEITRHIADVRAATAHSIDAVGRIEVTIGEIDAVAASIASAMEQQGMATAEIARHVTSTAGAARDTTTRIQEVSVEAERTGGQASIICGDAERLAEQMRDLGRTVVRIVRSSTDDVDRRHFQRARAGILAQARLNGGPAISVRIADVSEGSARLLTTSVVALGMSGMLLPGAMGLADPLPFTIVRLDPDGFGARFEVNDAARAALRGLAANAAKQRAA